MAKEKYGFVYIWRDKKHNRYYIGCHWGTEDDGYICSSNWMRDAYNRRPRDFRRRVLVRNLTREQMYVEEQRFFNLIKETEVRTRYYNLRLNTNTKPWHMDDNKNLTVGEKISRAKKGKKNGPMSEETKRKISEVKKGKAPNRSEKGIARWKEAMASRSVSDETKAKTSETMKKLYKETPHHNKGRALSSEHKAAISTGMQAKKTEKPKRINTTQETEQQSALEN